MHATFYFLQSTLFLVNSSFIYLPQSLNLTQHKQNIFIVFLLNHSSGGFLLQQSSKVQWLIKLLCYLFILFMKLGMGRGKGIPL